MVFCSESGIGVYEREEHRDVYRKVDRVRNGIKANRSTTKGRKVDRFGKGRKADKLGKGRTDRSRKGMKAQTSALRACDP